jgi:hypothetical protein
MAVIKPPLWRQQRDMPKLHAIGCDAAANELATVLNELPEITGGHRFNPQEVDLLAARIVMAYWRGVSGDGVR